MSTREQKYQFALYATLGISLLNFLITSPEGILLFRTAVGQQQEDQTNQTGTAALSANLTQSDFELLRQDLIEAKQALENNDTTTLLDELNSASGELFQVSSRQFDPDHVEEITEEFNPLQTHIDRAQETALKDNHTGTLKELSAAESELFEIIKMLPSGQN